MTCVYIGNEKSVQLVERLSKIVQINWSLFENIVFRVTRGHD
jgi:hypothetical protein